MFTNTPPPANPLKILIALLLTLGLLSAAPALAQDNNDARINLQLVDVGSDCIWLSYIDYPTLTIANLFIRPTSQNSFIQLSDGQIAEVASAGLIKFVSGSIVTINPDTEYQVYMDVLDVPGQGTGEVISSVITFRTDAANSFPCGYVPPPPPKKKPKPIPTPIPTPRPPVNTCPNLPPDILISGYVSYGSQCQVVDAGGVGRQDLLDRGIVAAVDIWSWVPSGVEVCFRNMGAAVVFLDAAYSPRLLSALEYTVRNGHTCAMIHTAGTVVLLAS